MATKTFDAVVIGGGPGGYVAAIRLAQLGKKAALVEKEALGGVCLNWGCIPSKALIAAANLVEEIKDAAERGIIADAPKVDVAKLREFKDGVVKKLVGGVGMLEKGNGVEVVKGTATFVAPNAIEVDGGRREGRASRRPAFIVATGARPIEIPGFEYDGKDVWSAKEAVDLPELPKRLVCIGGGIIGMELGTVYAKLGSQVTFLEALPQILTGVDPEAVRLVPEGAPPARRHGAREREGEGVRAEGRRARRQGRGRREGDGDRVRQDPRRGRVPAELGGARPRQGRREGRRRRASSRWTSSTGRASRRSSRSATSPARRSSRTRRRRRARSPPR